MTTKAERIVDRTELGKFLNVDADYVSVLVREGMPKVHHGRYELVRCLSWYVKHLQESLKKRGLRVPGDVGERETKMRILKAQAERHEVELRELKGELIPLHDVEKVLGSLIVETKTRMLAVGTRVAAELIGETSRSRIQQTIDSAVKEALVSCARGDWWKKPPHATAPAPASTQAS